MDSFLEPQLSLATQAFIRATYGVLLTVTLLLILPQSKRFLLSERYGGYTQSSRVADRIQSPRALPVILLVWFTCALMITAGFYAWIFALVNLVLCRYFFIHLRWKGLLRGMGAPGFMTYWLAACVFFLEYSTALEPTGHLRTIALLAFQLDLAAIMCSAGLYKIVAGYTKGHGMQFGMVNPQWGHHWPWYCRMPPDHILFKTLNQLAYGLELVFAVLALIPATKALAGLVLIASFFFITTQIRLWVLCEMVMLAGVIYFGPGSLGDNWIVAWSGPVGGMPGAESWVPPVVNAAIAMVLILYIGLLPLVHAGLYFNFLKRRALAAPVQRALELYTNFFGIIIWRVFTLDVVTFFINIYIEGRDGTRRHQWTHWGSLNPANRLRYGHVGESICVTSIFTTLRYYPSNSSLFRERLLRYARTIPTGADDRLRFEYVSIESGHSRRFDLVPVAEFLVDPVTGAIEQHSLDDRSQVLWGVPGSPVYEGARPGSYAPARSPATARSK